MFRKHHSFQSAVNLSIYQNLFLKKYFFSKNVFSQILLPQKVYFQNRLLKQYISKFAPIKDYTIKKYIIKIASSKNTFSKLFRQRNIHFQICSRKLHSQNCSLKNTFSKIKFSKFFSIKTLLESTESSKELYKSSMICLITFFSIYLQLKILMDNSFHLY